MDATTGRPESRRTAREFRKTGLVPLTTEDVYARLAEGDPRAAEFISAHLDEWHQVQDPYLLLEELRDFTLQLFREGKRGPLEAILAVISTAFTEGDTA